MPDEGIVFLFVLAILGSTVLLFPLVRALAERLLAKQSEVKR